MARSQSAFMRALEAFVAEPSKKRRPSFLAAYMSGDEAVGADEVHKAISDVEKHHSQKLSRRVLQPVFDAIKDYDAVISVLVSADPMPSALVWGGLKAVLECFKRYNSLFEKIEAQLKKLTFELRRLASYEELFNESEDMEKLLVSSYIHILKFWATVEEQCLTSTFLLAAKSLTSFRSRKIDEILADIAADIDNIAKLVPIVQERLRRGEQEDATHERREAGIALEQLLNASREEREVRRKQELRQWIRGGHLLNESNDRHQHKHEKVLLEGTGEWINIDERWKRWKDPKSEVNVLWLNGDPGVGKSVVCAYGARSIRGEDTSCATASQYFSFDEAESLSTVYRNIAEQLFHQLYSVDEEVSDHVYDVTQRPGNEATSSLKMLIRLFSLELKSTYIFLDGFDEEHSVKERWDNTSDIVSFFTGLAKEPRSTLKLWCSTQKYRKIQDLMKDAETIDLTPTKNGADIEALFAHALRTRNFVELDPVKTDQLLSNLKQQVHGNFLWASMMLDMISDASSLKQLQDMVTEGLPEDFEKYLANRMKRVKRTHHGLLSKVLSCMVYAKRPLLLDELCEAVSITDTDPGQNLCISEHHHRNLVVDNCAPWIRIDELIGQKSDKTICTLSHSSIRKFLIRSPDVLLRGKNCEISAYVFADVCLRYLEQKRYRKALKIMEDSKFLTACGEDIINHHLLGYCAKYWSRHLDEIPYSAELCKRVEDFVTSRNFGTTLQVQSLLVGGQFAFRSEQRGKHLVRMFPRWFTESHDVGKQLRRQYEEAIGEWGFFLDRVSTIKGRFPGEIDRCLWGSLPKSSFLHNIQSQYKCFVLESKNTEEFHGLSSLTFDNVEAGGSYINLFRTDNFGHDGSQSEIIHEKWSVGHTHRPKLVKTDRILVTMRGLKYYRSPLKYPISGRAAEASISDDGQIFRIGHGLFFRSQSSDYKFLDCSSTGIAYVEELACRGEFIVVASRRRITEQNLSHPFHAVCPATWKRPLSTHKQSHHQTDLNSTSTENDIASDSGDDGDESSSDAKSMQESHNLSQSAEESDGIESEFEEDDNFEQLADDSDDFDAASDSLEALSANESASDGSRSTLSNEVEDDRLWNDYASDDDKVDIERNELDTDAEMFGVSMPSTPDRINNSSSEESTVPFDPENDLETDNFSNGGNEYAAFHDFSSSMDSSSSSSGSDVEELAAEIFERLIQTERKADPAGKVSDLSVFKIDQSTQIPNRVFHYSQSTASPIFSSPPVFHPTLDLIVWPLGGENLLFANFTQNRYFTRLFSTGLSTSCHISVQCRFSPCGKYLHLVSLDGCIEKGRDESSEITPKLILKLHVSTHELSKSKPERSPPRLVYNTSVNLDREVRRDHKMSVPNLPYDFTWTPDYVYVTESSRLLKVIRISLYRDIDEHDVTAGFGRFVFKNVEEIYLPASADMRRVRFIPRDLDEQHNSEQNAKKEVVATVVILSSSSQDDAQFSAGSGSHLPQVIRITSAQFGRGWEPVETKDDETKMPRQNEKLRAGKLLTKFEKFDLSQDCDIIPFLC
ncbi:hypothetical protein BP6252_09998 [Coleophoma cylindrospora]|uniref:NACHT domain-containing protein n=1 Tax=Coleophoma cylindrospora TaxID=1849047 RepID=A0A3D8QX07_9HELO|nr:hypothetical protein BP6252_09998 [Coleophoma cylindrospora]